VSRARPRLWREACLHTPAGLPPPARLRWCHSGAVAAGVAAGHPGPSTCKLSAASRRGALVWRDRMSDEDVVVDLAGTVQEPPLEQRAGAGCARSHSSPPLALSMSETQPPPSGPIARAQAPARLEILDPSSRRLNPSGHRTHLGCSRTQLVQTPTNQARPLRDRRATSNPSNPSSRRFNLFLSTGSSC
jgi:hypothetical protein